MIKTNLWTKDQKAPIGTNYDSEEDYYKISDAIVDHNYMNAQIMETMYKQKYYTNECAIIYGGEITDAGSGLVDISACYAFTKDNDDNRIPVSIPAQSGVSLPSGWNDNRQIWIIAKYIVKTAGSLRNHYDLTPYYYQVDDSFYGESDTDDFFVDADPNSTPDLIVCLGSFQMNGTTFTEVFGERTENFILSQYDAIISDQQSFDDCFERTGANAYKVKDAIKSIYMKQGAYDLGGIISGGDTAPVVTLNNCQKLICERDDYSSLIKGIDWGAYHGYLQTGVDGIVVENLTIFGDGSATTADRTINVTKDSCRFTGCTIYNRGGTAKGFQQSGNGLTNAYIGCYVSTMGSSGFYGCTGLYHCYVEAGQGSVADYELCKYMTDCRSESPTDGHLDTCNYVNNFYGYQSGDHAVVDCTHINNITIETPTNSGFSGCVYANNCVITDSTGNGFIDSNFLSNCRSDAAGIRNFNNCDKLSNCSAVSGTTGNYYDCDQLSNCESVTAVTYGFDACEHLSNCKSNNSAGDREFSTCIQLSNCIATGDDVTYSYGFFSCTKLSGCYASGFIQVGFQSCLNLSSCEAFENDVAGFHSCEHLSSCKAEDCVQGFYDCFGISACYAYDNTSGFNGCTHMSSCRSISNSAYGFYLCKWTSAGCYGSGNAIGNWNTTLGLARSAETTCTGCDSSGNPTFLCVIDITGDGTAQRTFAHSIPNLNTNRRLLLSNVYEISATSTFEDRADSWPNARQVSSFQAGDANITLFFSAVSTLVYQTSIYYK